MKKRIITGIIVATLFLLTACSGNPTEKALQEDSWKDVNDGDSFTFESDGKGKHDDKDITYTVEENTVSITEGTGSSPVVFEFDDSEDVPKLSREDSNSYLVPAANYEEIGKKIMEENVSILTSTEMWTATKSTAFQQFLSDGNGTSGTGWLITMMGTASLSWEMIDNNTVRSKLPGGEESILTIVNEGGKYCLVNDNGETLYVPK